MKKCRRAEQAKCFAIIVARPSGLLTRCMRFAPLTQIAPLRSATSHTPETLGEIATKISYQIYLKKDN